MENGRAETVPPQASVDTQVLGDPEVVTAARDGDEWAWNLLVDRFAPAVWSWARAGDLTDDEAGEIFRLTWLRTADRLSVLSPGSIGCWLQDTVERERIRIAALQQVSANT
jgi:hypothetical protein